MSMKVERSTLGQVKARLETNKRKLEEAKQNDVSYFKRAFKPKNGSTEGFGIIDLYILN